MAGGILPDIQNRGGGDGGIRNDSHMEGSHDAMVRVHIPFRMAADKLETYMGAFTHLFLFSQYTLCYWCWVGVCHSKNGRQMKKGLSTRIDRTSLIFRWFLVLRLQSP